MQACSLLQRTADMSMSMSMSCVCTDYRRQRTVSYIQTITVQWIHCISAEWHSSASLPANADPRCAKETPASWFIKPDDTLSSILSGASL